jgi:hypothetical protein
MIQLRSVVKARRIFVGLAAALTSALVPELVNEALAQQRETAQIGDARFEVPQGWASVRRGDILVLSPRTAEAGDSPTVVVTPGVPLTDLDAQFRQLVQRIQSYGRTERIGDIVRGKSPDGYNVLRRELIVRDSSGAARYVFLTAADHNWQFQSLIFVATNSASYRRFGREVDGLVSSMKFAQSQSLSQSQSRPNTADVAPIRAAAPAVPDATTPAPRVAYIDAKSRANGERNLHPPPPGTARLSGLYVTEDSRAEMGPGGSVYSAVTWRFYYFLPNGYAYLGTKEAGLETLACDRPTVDKYGDPMCTTYSADNDQIRIGLLNPTRLRRKGEDLRIGDYDFVRVPKVSDLRLTGTYEYFSAGTSAAVSSSLTFFRDGRFEASNFTGVAVDTDPTNSGQTGGSRISVTGSGSGKSQGRYRINGYTLELNHSDGRQARALFAIVAGNDVVRIGSRTYIRH